MSQVVIVSIDIDPGLAAKVRAKHNVMSWEVREAVVMTPVVRAAWDHDPDRGSRLLVVGITAAGRRLKVVLAPIDEGEGHWSLRTAFPA